MGLEVEIWLAFPKKTDGIDRYYPRNIGPLSHPNSGGGGEHWPLIEMCVSMCDQEVFPDKYLYII